MRVFVSAPMAAGDQYMNVRVAILAADALMAKGHVPFVPHLNALWHMLAPRSYEEWLRWDLEWLRQCEALVRLPGESPGADREVAEARRLGIPVFFGLAEVP